MPAKWQQWMPFHIDRFKASPAVQAMHPAARIGYLYLLACSWQSEDCTIPADEDSLAELSGLGYDLWAVHGPRILRKFVMLDGRLRNPCAYEEWREAKRIYEARQEAAKRTNETRSPQRSPSRSPIRPADTITLTVTSTETEKEQKPSPNPRKKRVSEVKHSSDPRHVSCKAEIFSYYRERNDGEDPDWEGREGRALGMLLNRNPKLTAEGIRKLLGHRARSEVNHSERPAVWLGILTSYRNGPLNQFGKPLKNGAGNGKQSELTQFLEENRGSVDDNGNHERLKTGSEYFDGLLEALEQGT